ncbi:dihydrofolate synthase [Hydrogenimonas sp.]|nr:dihydrofolate synthase [Hydrogenimonas sp.]
MDLNDFLRSKPLYYDKIDLSRMPGAYALVERYLNPGRVVHIIGTNGKGSTGRILAELLRSRGYRVGHYTSPHISRFNERIWIEGDDISDDDLQTAHEKLAKRLPKSVADSLSYFEYTTLLALTAFENLDYTVLEAGLGGEFDATSVVPKELSVVTPIGLDHQAFLGDTVEEIAATKLRSIGRRAVVSAQPFKESLDIACRIAASKGSELYFAEDMLDSETKDRVADLCRGRGWPPFMAQNAATALAAASLLTGEECDLSVIGQVRIRGRFERVAENIILDVGHNALGARAVADALDSLKPVLVYNALADKDVDEILGILAPHISRLELIEIEGARAMEPGKIVEAAEKLDIEVDEFRGVDEKSLYLVFGSFYVAEAFLKRL